MTIATIRKKLQDYIQTADDKKVKAIFTLIESDLEKELNWWEDEELVNEFDNRVKNCIDGKEKGYTLAELDAEIENQKQVSN